jgi:hypothetical protein
VFEPIFIKSKFKPAKQSEFKLEFKSVKRKQMKKRKRIKQKINREREYLAAAHRTSPLR